MTAPAQQPAWPPPIGTRVIITVRCCGQDLAEARIAWTGEDRPFNAPGCPRGIRLPHTPTITYSWSTS